MLRFARVAVILVLADVAAAQPLDRERAQTAAEETGPASKQELFQRRPALIAAGTNVDLEDMVVRAKSGNVLRVAYGKHEIFVVPNDPSALDFIAVGAHVDVKGSLLETPSAPQARLVFAMNAREARRLARDDVYVDAWAVTARE